MLSKFYSLDECSTHDEVYEYLETLKEEGKISFSTVDLDVIKIKDNKDSKMTKCIKICDASYDLFCNVSKIFKSLKIPSKNIYKSIYSIKDNQIQMKSPVREFVFENCEGNAEYEEDADDNLDHNDEQDEFW